MENLFIFLPHSLTHAATPHSHTLTLNSSFTPLQLTIFGLIYNVMKYNILFIIEQSEKLNIVSCYLQYIQCNQTQIY